MPPKPHEARAREALNARRRERHLPPDPAEVGLAALFCWRRRMPADARLRRLGIGLPNDEAIARHLGIGRRTLARWKRRPEFAAAWAALHAEVMLDSRAPADPRPRLLGERWRKMTQNATGSGADDGEDLDWLDDVDEDLGAP